MFAFEKTRRRGHGRFIERPGIVQRAAIIEGRQNGTAIDAVTVCLSLGNPARMKILAHFFGGHDADGRRQQRVHGALEFVGGESRVRLEVGDLADCVDARVSAAGAVDVSFSCVICWSASCNAP